MPYPANQSQRHTSGHSPSDCKPRVVETDEGSFDPSPCSASPPPPDSPAVWARIVTNGAGHTVKSAFISDGRCPALESHGYPCRGGSIPRSRAIGRYRQGRRQTVWRVASSVAPAEKPGDVALPKS